MSYEPLSLPWKPHPWHSFSKARKDYAHINRQLKARGPIPPSVWGDDPTRQRVGAIVAKICEDCNPWESDRFIPDDPFWIVWGLPWGDLSEVEAIIRIEEQLGIELRDGDLRPMPDMTFGQVVDLLLNKMAASGEPWPDSGEDSLEPRPCASQAAFYDLRRFLVQRYGLDRRRVRPSAELADLVPFRDARALVLYVARRFNVDIGWGRRVLGICRFSRVWWAAYAIGCAIALFRWGSVEFILAGMILPIPLAIALALITWRTWLGGTRTVGGLVRLILAQRAQHQAFQAVVPRGLATGG